jgi:glycosyltransferase involved in cell wall biosynthesis
MRRALVYDWFAKGAGGGEKAFEAIYQQFPGPIYTLLSDPESLPRFAFAKEVIHSSFIQKLPFSRRLYRSYLPLFPLAVEQLDLSAYDLILSCSHSVAKGVLTRADQLHLCYCYTPMRYAWDLYHQYMGGSGPEQKRRGVLARLFLHYLRMWDEQSARRVDEYAAISHCVAQRIQKTYGRRATVIYPPVDTEFFRPGTVKEDYYVAASRFVGYKRMDLIVEAFAHMPQRRLVVIGEGPDLKKIRLNASRNVEFLGYQSNEVLRSHLQKAKGFVFAALEDFGIAPVEAQACGTPAIVLGRGGTRETVRHRETGLHFAEQTVSSLCQAIDLFESTLDSFDPTRIRRWAETFQRSRFDAQFNHWVEAAKTEWLERHHQCTY